MSQKQDHSTWGRNVKADGAVLPCDTTLWTPNRREAIFAAGAFGAGVVVGWPAESQANPLVLIGRAAFGGAVGWLVHRLLDRAFPREPDELRVVDVTNPRPSHDEVHNRHAAPYAITNPQYRFGRSLSRRGGFFIEVGPFVRCLSSACDPAFSDMNTMEMECSRQQLDGLLLPAGPRATPQDEATETLARIRRQLRGIDIDYVRPFLAAKPFRSPVPVQSQITRNRVKRNSERPDFRRVLGYGISEKGTGRSGLIVIA